MADTRRPASRIVFAVLGGPLVVVLIAVTALAITGTLARQSESNRLTFAEPVTKVTIDLAHGSITLRGTDRTVVSGERIVTRGIQSPSFSERVDGDTLVISSSCVPLGNTWCEVSYVLDIPRSVTVEAETAVGAVRAYDLTGSAHLQSATGRVAVENMSGPMRLESGAGSVSAVGTSSDSVRAWSGAGSVDLVFTTPPATVDAGSGAGSVDIVVPRDDTTYRIDQDPAGDRDIRIAVTTDPASTNVLTVSSGAGGVSVHYPEA